MAREKIDLNDGVMSPSFSIASGIAFGLFSITLFAINFAKPIWATRDVYVIISIDNTIAFLGVLIAYVTNRLDFGNLGITETWVAVTTILIYTRYR